MAGIKRLFVIFWAILGVMFCGVGQAAGSRSRTLRHRNCAIDHRPGVDRCVAVLGDRPGRRIVSAFQASVDVWHLVRDHREPS